MKDPTRRYDSPAGVTDVYADLDALAGAQHGSHTTQPEAQQ
jgi:hypothetical protein